MNIVKLNSLSRWRLLEKGKAIHFAALGNGERRIRLTVNVQLETALWLRDADGEERFLAALNPGVNLVEFMARGPFAVVPSDGDNELWYQTAEAEPNHVVISDPVIFTGIPQRRQRNPQLEAIMYMMRQNQLANEQKIAAQAEAFEKQLAKVKGEADAATAAKPPVGGDKPPKAGGKPADKQARVHGEQVEKPAKPRLDEGHQGAETPEGGEGETVPPEVKE